jgi:hypothetical protein
MGMGPISWACLLLAIHQGPAPVPEFYLNFRDLKIPIRAVNPQRQAQITSFVLYVSKDKGQTWTLHGKVPANQTEFKYRADQEGSFWFTLAEEDANGVQNPPSQEIFRTKPSMCVVIDTGKPDVHLTKAERQPDGSILVRWSIREEVPDFQSLRLEYHTDRMAEQQWTPVDIHQRGAEGEERFQPNYAGAVRVSLRIKDRADNEGRDEASLPAVGGAAIANGPPPTPPGSPTLIQPWPPSDRSTQPATLTSRGGPTPISDRPPPSPPGPAGNSLVPLDAAPDRLPSTPSPLASSSPLPAPGTPGETPRGALPPLQIVNKPEVKLDFEVAKVGPSGLGGVEVWVTANEGATWQRWPGEPVVSLPTTDLHGTGPVRGSVRVQLAQNGLCYGFIVVVKSKAGLGRQPPRPGEPPQARIELDTVPPLAQLREPLPDRSQPNTLIMYWSVTDRNLASPKPITLEWAERPNGTWNRIGGDDLPNVLAPGTPQSENITGSFVWQLPDRDMPSRVYLRLSVRDAAGNVAVAQTAQPILIDLSVPETSIINASPAR